MMLLNIYVVNWIRYGSDFGNSIFPYNDFSFNVERG